MKTLSSFVIALLLFAANSYAQTKKDTLSIERALSVYTEKNLSFSPDGSKAVAVISQAGIADNLPAAHIWLIDVASGAVRQFTNSQKSESSPRWSPDGKTLAFLSGRNGKPQVFLMDVSGGEAIQLTDSKTGVSAFEWGPDGKMIAYLADEDDSPAKKKRQDDKYDENVVSEASNPTRVFTIDIGTKKTTQLTKQNWEISEMKWMPQSNALLLVAQMLPEPEIPAQKLVMLALKDSSVTNLPVPASPFWGNIEVSPDGQNVAYISSLVDEPTGSDIFMQSLKTGKSVNLTANLDRDIMGFKWVSSHEIKATVQRGFKVGFYTITDKAVVKDGAVDQTVLGFDVSAKGATIFTGYSATSPAEIFTAAPGKKPVQVSHFNKAFDSITLVKPVYITYKSFDSLKVEAAFYKPVATSNKPLPLVVFIHGGPTSAFYDVYSAWVQLFVQKGYAVFCPNIRGSTGYGLSFMSANRYDWGGKDFKDIMAGIDYLVANNNIDSTRVGITGWSYGGYMAEWAITQTNRFKAAMSGAGMADLASEFGTEDNAAYDHWSMGSPYEQADVFYKHSPITFIKNAKTPTLIIQGEEDDTDPKGQAQQLYRGLRYYNVPTELVLYPREPHGFKEMKHNIDFYTRMLAWFDKYMPADKPAVAEKKK